METLPNLYFAGFYSRFGNSNKKKRYIWSRQLGHDKLVSSRQGIPQISSFLSHDLSKHVAAKSVRQRPQVAIENQGHDKK